MRDFCCSMCGMCCRKGGPALHVDDSGILAQLGIANLVCLRRGELAYDPQVNAVRPLAKELLKIRGKGCDWECIFFDPQARTCSIYEYRPVECRELQCDDVTKIFSIMSQPYIDRSTIVRQDCALWECIIEHERLFPMDIATGLARKLGDVSSEYALDTLVCQEMCFRSVLMERICATDEDLWPYLGRPLWLALLPLRPGLRKFGSG